MQCCVTFVQKIVNMIRFFLSVPKMQFVTNCKSSLWTNENAHSGHRFKKTLISVFLVQQRQNVKLVKTVKAKECHVGYGS